jgi:hypothetical protein
MSTSIPVDQLPERLQELDRASTEAGAEIRQQAQEVLAEPSVDLPLREAIADRLGEANQLLTLKTATKDDSY